MIRPYQVKILDRLLVAMSDVNTNHVGLTMVTGSGPTFTIAQAVQDLRMLHVVDAARHQRNIDVVVVGLPELTAQFRELIDSPHVNVFSVNSLAKYEDVANAKIPRFWDLTIVLEQRLCQEWWYNHQSITLNPCPAAKTLLDYTIEMSASPTGWQLVETSPIST